MREEVLPTTVSGNAVAGGSSSSPLKTLHYSSTGYPSSSTAADMYPLQPLSISHYRPALFSKHGLKYYGSWIHYYLFRFRIINVFLGIFLLIVSYSLDKRNTSRQVSDTTHVFSSTLLRRIGAGQDSADASSSSFLNAPGKYSTSLLSRLRGKKVLTHIPQAENILIDKLPRGYLLGDPIPLPELVAFEVRRYRRNERRNFTDPLVPLLDEGRKNKKKGKDSSKAFQSSLLASKDVGLKSLHLSSETNPFPWNTQNGRALPRSHLESSFFHNIFISEKLRLMYCAIPFAGSWTWKTFFRKVDGLDEVDSVTINDAALDKGLNRLSDYSIRDRERILEDKGFYRFLFSRNPMDRAVAAYRHKILNANTETLEYREFVAKLRGKTVSDHDKEMQKMSFSFFLVYLSKRNNDDDFDEFLSSQASMCGLKVMSYDQMFKYENFSTGVEDVLSNSRNLDFQRIFPSHIGIELDTKADWKTQFDEQADNKKNVMRVAKIYSEDYKIFGYVSS